MSKVGVRFEGAPTAAQAALDRFVFALIQKRARARRPLDEKATPGAERRVAPRVELGQGEEVSVEIVPGGIKGALGGAKPAAGPSFKVRDISTTGCAFDCPPPAPVQPKQKVTLRLRGKDLDVELPARVIHVTEGS